MLHLGVGETILIKLLLFFLLYLIFIFKKSLYQFEVEQSFGIMEWWKLCLDESCVWLPKATT